MIKKLLIASTLSGVLLSGFAIAETETKTTEEKVTTTEIKQETAANKTETTKKVETAETKQEAVEKKTTEKKLATTETKQETGENKTTTIDSLKEQLTKTFRRAPDSLTKSPIEGVYQVLYGTEVVYVSADAKYFIAGDMIDMATHKNLSKIAQRSVRNAIIKDKFKDPIVFKAKDEKHVIKVFTDIDCPYCAKLHRQVPALNEKGITVEYAMFPRAGIGSKSYDKAVSVWCAGDSAAQQSAMTAAKARKPFDEKKCDNPVKAQYELGQEIGVTGTPALVTETGRLIPGYIPADRLAKMLEADQPKTILQK